jgi:hypothetical protein
MSDCSGDVESQGTGQASSGFKAFKKAIAHFMLNGQAACAQKTCDSGTCTFGVTANQMEQLEISDPTQVGDKVRVSVRGEGTCFCK